MGHPLGLNLRTTVLQGGRVPGYFSLLPKELLKPLYMASQVTSIYCMYREVAEFLISATKSKFVEGTKKSFLYVCYSFTLSPKVKVSKQFQEKI